MNVNLVTMSGTIEEAKIVLERSLEATVASHIDRSTFRHLGPMGLIRWLWSDDQVLCLYSADWSRQSHMSAAYVLAGVSRASKRVFVDPIGAKWVSRSWCVWRALGAARSFLLGVAKRRRARRRARQIVACAPPSSTMLDRVLIVFPGELGVQSGGAASHLHGVVQGLRGTGSDVHILSGYELPRALRLDPQRTRLATSVPARNRSTKAAATYALNEQLKQEGVAWARECPFTCVYARHLAGFDAGATIATALGIPLILEFNADVTWMDRNITGLPVDEVHGEMQKSVVRSASVVVCVSEEARDVAVNLGAPAERAYVMPNGVDLDRFVDVEPALIPELPEDEHVIGFVGTFGPWHGAPILAEAFVRISQSYRVRLLLVGRGVELEKSISILERGGVRDRVCVVGTVPGELVPAYLAACDILASPHVTMPHEVPFFGSPTKLFEYMASGRAIVASRLGQIGRILRDGSTALLVRPDMPQELEAAIATLLHDESLRERLGRAARDDAFEHHGWPARFRDFRLWLQLEMSGSSQSIEGPGAPSSHDSFNGVVGS